MGFMPKNYPYQRERQYLNGSVGFGRGVFGIEPEKTEGTELKSDGSASIFDLFGTEEAEVGRNATRSRKER